LSPGHWDRTFPGVGNVNAQDRLVEPVQVFVHEPQSNGSILTWKQACECINTAAVQCWVKAGGDCKLSLHASFHHQCNSHDIQLTKELNRRVETTQMPPRPMLKANTRHACQMEAQLALSLHAQGIQSAQRWTTTATTGNSDNKAAVSVYVFPETSVSSLDLAHQNNSHHLNPRAEVGIGEASRIKEGRRHHGSKQALQ
jgi:hypothetical protein